MQHIEIYATTMNDTPTAQQRLNVDDKEPIIELNNHLDDALASLLQLVHQKGSERDSHSLALLLNYMEQLEQASSRPPAQEILLCSPMNLTIKAPQTNSHAGF